MNKYVQYVVCRFRDESEKHLFYAPAFSSLNEGDEILVETQIGEQRATVLAVCTTSNEDVEKALCALTGGEDKPVKRVIGKYNFVKFDYSEDESNE